MAVPADDGLSSADPRGEESRQEGKKNIVNKGDRIILEDISGTVSDLKADRYAIRWDHEEDERWYPLDVDFRDNEDFVRIEKSASSNRSGVTLDGKPW